MRMKLVACASLLAATAVLAGAQEPKKKTDDNLPITVTGCVDKSYLHVKAVDRAGGGTASYAERYKLRGSKQLIKEIASKYDRHLVEVTGFVEDLSAGTAHRGKTIQVGKKTRITTGAKDVPQTPEGSDATLEVQSFRDLKDKC